MSAWGCLLRGGGVSAKRGVSARAGGCLPRGDVYPRGPPGQNS